MASFNQNTIILIPLISLLCLISFTHAREHHVYNETLVELMCEETSYPDTCISCIKYSGQNVATDVDVISITLDCGDSEATNLGIAVNKILDDVSTDPDTKRVLYSINPVIGAIISDGGTVDVLIAQRKFGEARYAIYSLIFPHLRACKSAFAEAKITIPPPVSSGLHNIEVDYQVTDQLLAETKE